jgi:GT2 family glycosyltransferase
MGVAESGDLGSDHAEESVGKAMNDVFPEPRRDCDPVIRLAFSIVVLTYNRNHLLEGLLSELSRYAESGVQVIVVDNCSECPASEVTGLFPWVVNILAPKNLGAAGRNLGFDAASGDVVVCLDDDIAELSHDALECLERIFADRSIAAVNFKVLDQKTQDVVNWVHHREVEKYSDQSFDTYEITEGAVAFRRAVLDATGGYAEEFFLSHEGPDLAFRLINRGFRVIYSPDISVSHSFDPGGRLSWRNYYYDTRNTLWLVARNLPVVYGAIALLRQNAAMFVYSIRDGYTKWWFKGMLDGIKGLGVARGHRDRLSKEAMARIRAIDSHRPSVLYSLRKRFLSRDLKL